jgi:SAM-dependent methyltransferase
MAGWTRAQIRHVFRMFRFGRQPAATVYESIGNDFFLAFAPGWLNLGLWEGPGDDAEAPTAPRRLVETLCDDLPTGGVILDVGNGLGAQDPVIAERVRPRRLVALNISEYQLCAGRAWLDAAGAAPLAADATHLPLAERIADGVISVEAPFHFPSRVAFFAEAKRVLRPGGVLVMSDFAVPRMPRGLFEYVSGIWSMRFWGLRRAMLASPQDIAEQLRGAGFADVTVRPCGAQVIDPAIRVMRRRFRGLRGVPRLHRLGARVMLAQWAYLRRRGLLDYVLVRAS